MLFPFGHFIDLLEERLASEDDDEKSAGPFSWGEGYVEGCSRYSELAFIECLRDLMRAGGLFQLSSGRHDVTLSADDGFFLSPAPVGDQSVDRAHFKWMRGRSNKHAIVIIPHWNADPAAYGSFAEIFRAFGSSAAVLTLPYHGCRKLPCSRLANEFVSANIGRTIAAVRQTVLDCQLLCEWIAKQDIEKVTVVGVSLGSCVAAVVAATSDVVDRAALLLTAGDFGSVVLTGRATRHIERALRGRIEPDLVRAAWESISPNTYAIELARRQIPLLSVSGSRDRVVLPELTREFEAKLHDAGARLQSVRLSCGHYTLSKFPFNVLALLHVLRFVHRT